MVSSTRRPERLAEVSPRTGGPPRRRPGVGSGPARPRDAGRDDGHIRVVAPLGAPCPPPAPPRRARGGRWAVRKLDVVLEVEGAVWHVSLVSHDAAHARTPRHPIRVR